MASDGGTYCKKVCVCTLVSVLPLGVIGLIIVGVTVAKPAVTALRLREAVCTVTSSTIGEYVSCKCGRNCRSSFPCLQISVLYSDEKGRNGTTSHHRSLLVDNQAMFGETLQCAAQPCGRSYYDNQKEVEDYRASWGTVGQRFPCFYDPADDAEVARTVIFGGKWAAFHALFWPLLVVFLSLAVPLLVR